ncbi:MAG: hypothetical protein FWE12_07270 [Oscillospiraceae bacterium]|nr:hypothetical protein [Oscillospiraceae bacterium]
MEREQMLQLTGFQPVGDVGRGLLLGFPAEAEVLSGFMKDGLTLRLYGDAATGKQIKAMNKQLKDDARLNGKVSIAADAETPGVAGVVTISAAGEGDINSLYRNAIDAVEKLFREEGINPVPNCPICEQTGGDTLVHFDGPLCVVHMTCLRNWKNAREEEVALKAHNGGHMRGFIGGFIGGVVGAAPAFIALMLTNYFVGLLFALIPLGTFYGWKLAGGKLDRITTIFVVLYSLVVGVFVEIIDSWLVLREALPAFNPSLWYTIQVYLNPAHRWHDLFFRHLLMALGFTLLGIFISWSMIRKTDKHELADNQAAFDEAIPLSQLTRDR